MLGTIAIEEIEVFAYHGVYAPERETGNRFWVDLYLQAPIEVAGERDLLSETVDYKAAYEAVLKVMKEPVHLLETLVVKIGRQILSEQPTVQEVRVRVTKARPLAMEKCKHTYVEGIFGREG